MKPPPFKVPPAILHGVLRSRARAQDVVDHGVPPEVALNDLTWGVQRTALAGVLVTSGIADALAEGTRSPAELADELGLDHDVTGRVLSAAAVMRFVAWDGDGRVKLTRIGGPLRRDHPMSAASWVATQASGVVLSSYAQLGALLREGDEPSGVRRAIGKSLWEYYGDHPDEGAQFGRAMREMTKIDIANLVRGYPWPRRGVICDVAGGIGTLLAAILERRPEARGILVDSADVVAEAEDFLRARGVGDRVERRAGDLFGEIQATADLYLMKWILHDWSDDACREMLARVKATMPSGAKLVTIDQHLEPGKSETVAPILDIHMLVMCEGGRERNPDEVHGLMRDAGLLPGKVRHAGLHMLVEASAP